MRGHRRDQLGVEPEPEGARALAVKDLDILRASRDLQAP